MRRTLRCANAESWCIATLRPQLTLWKCSFSLGSCKLRPVVKSTARGGELCGCEIREVEAAQTDRAWCGGRTLDVLALPLIPIPPRYESEIAAHSVRRIGTRCAVRSLLRSRRTCGCRLRARVAPAPIEANHLTTVQASREYDHTLDTGESKAVDTRGVCHRSRAVTGAFLAG